MVPLMISMSLCLSVDLSLSVCSHEISRHLLVPFNNDFNACPTYCISADYREVVVAVTVFCLEINYYGASLLFPVDQVSD